MKKNDKKINEKTSDLWIPLFLMLAMPPKTNCMDVQVAELKGRVDTLERIILKGDRSC